MQIAISIALLIIGAFLGAFLTYYFGLKRDKEIHDYRERQRVFGQMMGLKFMTMQLYVSRFEALIYSDYHEALWKLQDHPSDSLDLKEAQRWMWKSEDLAMEIDRNNRNLFETLGLIRTLFPATVELHNLVERIYRARAPGVQRPPGEATNRDMLNHWKDKAVRDLQELVEREYGGSIDNLVQYLRKQLAGSEGGGSLRTEFPSPQSSPRRGEEVMIR